MNELHFSGTKILTVLILCNNVCVYVCVRVLLVLFLFTDDEEKRRSAGMTEQVSFFCQVF